MISHNDIKNLVSEWGLREDIIEKDYVIGWILWGIGSDPDLGQKWAFKGGTSLKKCYIETWRFSEDLDFTVLPEGPAKPEEIEPLIKRVLERVYEESGIDFSVSPIRFKHNADFLYTEGSVYYRGPRNAPTPSRIKLDISGSEKIACPTVLRKISHPYNDSLPKPAHVRCYAFQEVFAEKLRAMGERGRPRDLYDIVLLFRRRDLQLEPRLIKAALEKKCQLKNVPVPSLSSIENASNRDELTGEWENMLGHQLQALPPFEQFWEDLPKIFSWLEGRYAPEKVEKIPVGKDIEKQEDFTWSPPPTIWKWGVGVPLESIRFAAVNHLCVELGYGGDIRIIEPYSLRRTKDGNLILHAIKTATQESRSYRVDRIESVKVTTKTFQPRYVIEFSASGAIRAQDTERKSDFSSYGSLNPFSSRKSTRSRAPKRSTGLFGMKYVFQCGMCMKKFTKSTNDSKLRAHKDSFGIQCSSRHGYLIGYK